MLIYHIIQIIYRLSPNLSPNLLILSSKYKKNTCAAHFIVVLFNCPIENLNLLRGKKSHETHEAKKIAPLKFPSLFLSVFFFF